MRRARKFEMPFEVERGRSTVEYVVEFTVTPGAPERGPTYDCAGEPGYGPEVEDKTVYFEKLVACVDHRYAFSAAKKAERATCRTCRKVREERPELADLVDDEELLEYAGQAEENDREAAAEARAEARREDRMLGID